MDSSRMLTRVYSTLFAVGTVRKAVKTRGCRVLWVDGREADVGKQRKTRPLLLTERVGMCVCSGVWYAMCAWPLYTAVDLRDAEIALMDRHADFDVDAPLDCLGHLLS